MTPNLYTQQSKNTTKTWFLMAVFFVLIIFIGWFLSFYYGNANILYIAFIISLVMNVGSYWFSDKIVLSLSGAHLASKEKYYDYYTISENLAITTGLPLPKLYVIEDSSPNAFATGRNKDHSAIAVTTGLLALLDKNELEGVIAHEMAHIGNKDILLQTIVVVLVGLITLLADFFFRMSFSGNRGDNNNGGGHIQMIILALGIVFMILSPIIATLIQLAISRKREFLADATGALTTRYPDGLANALEKIEANSHVMKKANHATAHLFISDPFTDKKKKVGFMTKLFMTHPPTHERVASLRGLKIE